MDKGQSSLGILCPLCQNTDFESDTSGFIIKTTMYECQRCESVIETKDGEKFKVIAIGDGFSNTTPFMQDKILTRDKLANPGLPILSDEELGKLSIGEGETFQELINEQDQNVPIILKKDERVMMHLPNVTLSEERSKQVSSGGGAISFKIAKGIWFHTGGLSAPEYKSALQVLYSGALIVTTKRYVFLGSNKHSGQNLSSIVAIKPFNDGLGVVRSDKQKTEYYQGPYHWPLMSSVFMGVVNNYS
jgi:hypothetical protein